MERLQKIIAMKGYCSRRKAEELIQKGKVRVNGELVTTMGYKASVNDFIEVEEYKTPEDAFQKSIDNPSAVLSVFHILFLTSPCLYR